MEVFTNGQINNDILTQLFETHSAAIFDMDGTLLDSMTMWHDIDRQFLARYNCEEDEAFQRAVAKMTLDDGSKAICERYNIPRTPGEVKYEFLEMVDDYYRNKLLLKPGALSLVKRLHEQGISIYVATANEDEITKAALERTEVLSHIDGFVTCRMANAGKESPAIFLLACEKMNKHISDCIVFEDSLYAMETAKKAGFDVVAVYDEESKNDWNEICKISKCQVVF